MTKRAEADPPEVRRACALAGDDSTGTGSRQGQKSIIYARILTRHLLSATVLSHFGWLGSPRQPVTPMGILGVIVMIIGIVLTRR